MCNTYKNICDPDNVIYILVITRNEQSKRDVCLEAQTSYHQSFGQISAGHTTNIAIIERHILRIRECLDIMKEGLYRPNLRQPVPFLGIPEVGIWVNITSVVCGWYIYTSMPKFNGVMISGHGQLIPSNISIYIYISVTEMKSYISLLKRYKWERGPINPVTDLHHSITIYGVVCVQLAHLRIGDWKDISIAHVIIIIKSEVSTFPIVFIFFGGCVPEMFVTSYSVTYCIYIPGKPGICFHQYCAVYDECK